MFAPKFVLRVMGVEQISLLGMGKGVLATPERIILLKSVLWVGVFLINYVLGMGDWC